MKFSISIGRKFFVKKSWEKSEIYQMLRIELVNFDFYIHFEIEQKCESFLGGGGWAEQNTAKYSCFLYLNIFE